MNTAETLPDWAELFSLAIARPKSDIEPLLSQQNLAEEKEINTKAALFRSSKKKPVVKLSPSNKAYISFPTSDVDLLSQSSISNMITHFDTTLNTMHQRFTSLALAHDALIQTSQEAATAHAYQLTQLQTQLGTQPDDLQEPFNAPTLWSTVGNLVSEVTQNSLDTPHHSSSSNEQNNATQQAFTTQALLEAKHQMTLNVDSKITNMDTRFQNSISSQKTQCDKLTKNIVTFHSQVATAFATRDERLSHLDNNIQSIGASHPHKPHDLSMFLTRLSSVEDTLKTTLSNQDKSAIKFNSLGFRSQQECNTWMAMHSPAALLGLVVDVHSVMEHIYKLNSKGDNTIKNMFDNSRVNLTSATQAVCVTSFDQVHFRFFNKDGKTYILDDHKSFFPPLQHLMIGKNHIKVIMPASWINSNHITPLHNYC